MLNLIFKKEMLLKKLIYNYLENLGMIQKHFVRAMNICLKEGASNDFGWFLTPAVACFIAIALYVVVHLRYLPEF